VQKVQTKLISIVVPVYNEARNLRPFYSELAIHTAGLGYEFEFIFIDDGSRDASVATLCDLAKDDERVHIVQLARNFGKEAAVSAGLHATKGAAAIIMDSDMQMPASLIGEFVKRWEAGAEVVVGVFSSRNMSRVRATGAKIFYRIMRTIAHTKITPHATDFRLLDRQVIDVFNDLPERNRITRGLIDWMGFERAYVPFEQAPRLHGDPTYDFRSLVQLAMNSFTAYSLVPLKLAGYLGVVILLLSIPVGLFMFAERFLLGDPLGISISGTAFLAIMILFLVGVVLACLGLISLYIAHIHSEVIDRPLYIARRTVKVRKHPSLASAEVTE
jgi:dolichol-phosphate mannosyltransferase